jgi:hypothetical protein
LAGVAVLALAGISLWIFRLEAARAVAGHILAQSGVRATAFTIDRLNPFSLHVHDIVLNDGAIGIGELTLTYSPWSLALGRIDSITLLRPHLGITTTGGQVSIGGIALPAQATSSAAPVKWRIGSIKLVDADISAATPNGDMHAVVSADLALAGTDIQNAALDLDVSLPIGGANHLLHITAPALALTSRDGGLKLSFAQGVIAAKDLPWTMDDISGEIVWRQDGLTAKLVLGRLSNTQSPALIQPVSLTGDATMQGATIDFSLHAAAAAPGHPALLHLDATGTHDRASGQGALRITSTPLTFQANGLQPRDVSPALGATLPQITGTASLGGTISWRGAAISPALTLHIANGGAAPQGALLSNIHGDIAITSLAPLATAARQSLQGTIVAGGMPPSQLSLVFQLLATPALRVDALHMDFAGGDVSAGPFTIDPAHHELETSIGFKQIDLASFFNLAGIDGLGGTGKLDGQIALQLAQGKIIIHDGTLSATGPGVLNLRSDALPKQISEAGESVTLVLKALADFHYDSLVVALAGDMLGQGVITLKIQGNNPTVLEGQPFNLNIKLETNFERLIDLALRSMQAAQELLRQTIGRAQQ